VTQTASELLECLVRLPEDRIGCTRRLRELLEEGRLGSVEQAVQALSEGELPDEATKVLLGQLKQVGCLSAVLKGVHGRNRQRCRELLSLARAEEPRLHLRLSQRLMELLNDGSLVQPEEILYLFDGVVYLNGFTGLGPALVRLKEAKDPRLRAKAALLSASLPGGRHLLEWFREDPDPRMRGSIVEHLWPSDEPVARLVFEEALRDPQPRVRANGLLGFYRQGDLRALTGLAKMAEAPQVLHRAAARWAMEVIREPRFEPLLAKLRKELGNAAIKCEPGYPEARPGKRKLKLGVARMEWTAAGKLRVLVSIRLGGEEALNPGLRPMDLRAWVDGEPVLDYVLSRSLPPSRLAVGLVLPLSLRGASERAPGIRGSLDQLMTMPEGEWRAVGFYRSGLFMRNADSREAAGATEGTNGPDTARVRTPVFLPDGARFSAELKDAAQETNLAAEPGDLALAMLNRLKLLRSTGHVGVVLDEALNGPPRTQTIISSIRQCSIENGLAVHVFTVGNVSTAALEPWIALSRECGGFRMCVPTEDDLPEALRHWMLCFRELHVLEFEAPAAASEMRLQAVHPSGFGEATIPVDAVQCQR
jgi:HEAT repeat protein